MIKIIGGVIALALLIGGWFLSPKHQAKRKRKRVNREEDKSRDDIAAGRLRRLRNRIMQKL